MNLYEQQLKRYATQTNDAMRGLLSCPGGCLQMAVIDAMRYSLLDAGKRLRAALTLEFARLCGAPREDALLLACSIEMIHAYSLIHDDLPCMDDDDFRRGKPSCHKQFGEATALLAGDGLLTLAFETVAGTSLTAQQRCEAVLTLAKAAGIYGMIGGQVIDLASEGMPVRTADLDHMYTLKTGALLRAAAGLGCIAGDADANMREAADFFARDIGLAFQITDDILDVEGDEEKLGKPMGSDSVNDKSTYVSLLGVKGARTRATELIQQAKESISGIADNGFLNWIADMVLTRDH